MKNYQSEFIEFALKCKALRLGEFTLKSGRISPYFFNAGMFHDGEAFYKLASFYAATIQENFSGCYDVLFGPAYKGISLATSASIGLKIWHDRNVPVSFNRKEIKTHGEGGEIIGASLLNQRVLLIDDVITAGTTIRESVNLIQSAGAKLVGIVVALDRQEKANHSDLSAIQEVAKSYSVAVSSIISLDNLIAYLKQHEVPDANNYIEKIATYRALYGNTL